MRNSEKDLRLPPANPTHHYHHPPTKNRVMARLRVHIATELATLNPSALAGAAKKRKKRLHADVERRLGKLVSDLQTPTHPPYSSMIHRAIAELNEGAGSSEKAISELIVREYENLPLGHEGILRHHLGKLCKSGEVMRMVDGRYSIRVDSGDVNKGVVVVEERKNRKKRRGRKRGVSRPSGVKDRGGEETNGGEIGEENGCIEQEIEGHTEAQGVRIDGIDEEKKGEEEREEVVGKLVQGNIEINDAVKEQSEAEKQDMEVTEEQIQMTSWKLNDKEGSNGEETLQAFIKAKAEANENNEYIEVGEQHEDQPLGIISEQNEPQPEQTEVNERQEEEEVQNNQRQDKAKSNNNTILESPFSEENVEAGEQQTEMIDERQPEQSFEPKEIQPQNAEEIEKQIQLEEVQKQHQQDCSWKKDKTEVKHNTIASAPTATTPLVGPSSDGQQVNMEKQSARKKKLSVPQQQDLNQAQLQRRKLRSYTLPNNPESATSSTIMEPSSLSQQHDELQQRALHEGQEKQDQRRPPKQKRDEKTNTNTKTEFPLDSHPHHEEQPLKCRSVRGRLPKQTPDADAIMEASNVQIQKEQQSNQAQVQRRVLRSQNKEPSVSQSPEPTMAFSSLPPENRDMQQQQERCQERSPNQEINAVTSAVSALSSASQHHEEDQQPPKQNGQGSAPKLKTATKDNAGLALSSALQDHKGEDKQPPETHDQERASKRKADMGFNTEENKQPRKLCGRGGPPELKTLTDLDTGSALCLASQHNEEDVKQPPKHRGKGRPANPVSSAYRLKHHGQGRPPNPIPSANIYKGCGLGRPPNPIPSKYMLIKYGNYQFPSRGRGRGRGRPPKAKQDANSTEDVALPSNTHLEKLEQKHKRGQGRPPKAEEGPPEVSCPPERP